MINDLDFLQRKSFIKHQHLQTIAFIGHYAYCGQFALFGQVFQSLGVILEEVGFQYVWDVKELLGVYYVFIENLVHRADVDTKLFGKPAVGFLLPSQLLFDYQSYVNVRPHLF